MKETRNPILLALDFPNLDVVGPLLEKVAPHIGGVKVGLELMHSVGTPRALQFIKDKGVKLVFADGKLFDIGNTVSGATHAITISDNVDMINVAAAAGFDAIWAAVGTMKTADTYVVTVLTSMTEEDCHLTYGAPIKAKVLEWARWAKLASATGIICSAQHLQFLRKRPELAGLKYITPGVRSPKADTHDQQQVDTPANAILNGADYIVVGREVTQAADPIAAAQRILRDIAAAQGKES